MNRERLQELVSAFPKDTTPAEIAAAVSSYGTVYPLTDSDRGDVGLVRGGGLGADRWGQGKRKGDVQGVRAQFANAPDDTNIGVRVGDAEFVIDMRDRKVRGPHLRMPGSVRTPTQRRSRKAKVERESERLPPLLSCAKADAALRSARARQATLEAKLREEERSLADLHTGAGRAETRAARRKESIGRSFVDALRDGRDPPDFADDREKVLRDELEASARKALIPETAERVRQAKRALEEHKRTLSDAALDLDASLTESAATQTAKALKQLFQPLAALEAVGLVRASLLGTSFSFDPRRHRAPVGTAELVSSIADGIPPSLESALSRDAIHKRAHTIAAELLAAFQPRKDGE